MKVLATNKKAYFNFQILEKFEGGISLTGQEVKSIKTSGVSLEGSYIIPKKNKKGKTEFFWVASHISPYQPENVLSYHPKRERKILFKKREINYLLGKIKERGLTLVPIRLYNKKGWLKLEIALAKGRKKREKKEILKKRAIEKEIERTLKEKR
ncbi:MAG: SsrA-binding protein SmpB [Minisyncoccales bacterium]